MTGLKKIIRRLGYFAATLIILAALFVSIARLLTPVLNEHLPDFETWSTNSLKVPVKIGRVKIAWAAYEPQLEFNDVTILNKETLKPQFEIDSIIVNFSIFRSIFVWKPITEYIKVEGLHLTIRQPTSGHLLIDELKDIAVSDNATNFSAEMSEVLSWLFTQQSLILGNVGIDYHLPSGLRKSITLEHLELINNADKHQLSGDASLNQEIPMHAHVQLAWTGNIVDFNNIPSNVAANLYVYIEAISLPQWFGKMTWHNLQIKQGLGSTKIWAAWNHSELQKIQSRFQFYDLQLETLTTHETQDISRISGHVGWRRQGQEEVFAGNDILIDLPEHLWPVTNFVVTAVPTANGLYDMRDIRVGYLDLADTIRLAKVSALLPDNIESTFTELDPKGELHALHIVLPNGFATDPINIGWDAEFAGLTINQIGKLPGMTNATGIFDWNGTLGNLRLDSNQTSISYKPLFAKPLQFDQLFAALQWQKAADGGLSLNLVNFHAVNSDINANGGMTLTIPVKDSPTINLSSYFDFMNVTNFSKYIPSTGLDSDLVKWLQHAFLAGEINRAKVIIQGRLDDFPFEKNNGTFNVSGLVKNLNLHFAPNWPELQQLNGVLTFSGSKMSTDIDSGQISGAQVKSIHAEIPYIGAKQPQILHVQGSIDSDMAQGLAFIRQSPLQNTIGKDLAAMQLSGPMQLKLRLVIPLKKIKETTVQGDIDLSNVSMNLPQWNLSIDKLSGGLHFTEQNLQSSNLHGLAFGQPATLSLMTQCKKNQPSYLQANLQSTLEITSLEKWLNMPLSKYAQGASPYQAELHLAHADNQASHIAIKSDLKGIAINLPDPYGKKAEDVSNLQLDLDMQPGKPIIADMSYGKLISAALLYQNAEEGMHFSSGEILLGGGKATIPSQQGLVVTAGFNQLNWETIQPYVNWIKNQINAPASNPETSGIKTNASGQDFTKLFRSVNIKSNSADLFGQRLNNALIQISSVNKNWLINISSDQVAGQLNVANNFSTVSGNFQHFYVISSSSETKQYIDPKTLPALNINANDVRYGEMHLGNVSLQTSPSQSGLLIKQLQADADAFRLQATGLWRAINKRYTTTLQGNLTSSNVSQMLSQWGLNAPALVGSNGNASFNLTWPDAPYNPSMGIMSGNLSLKLGSGRIINLSNSTETKLGLGRLFNFLSLQSLPDISNLFQKGYAFDYVKADFKLNNGNANTDNLHIDGSLARVDMSGRIGLRDKDYNLKLIIAANVSSSLPIAATIVSGFNPIVGVATWAVGKVVGSQVNRVSTYTYRVTGPWENPMWQQVQ